MPRTLSSGRPYSEPDKVPDERQTQMLIRHHVRRLGKLGVAVSSLRPDTARQNETAAGSTTRQIHRANAEPIAQ